MCTVSNHVIIISTEADFTALNTFWGHLTSGRKPICKKENKIVATISVLFLWLSAVSISFPAAFFCHSVPSIPGSFFHFCFLFFLMLCPHIPVSSFLWLLHLLSHLVLNRCRWLSTHQHLSNTTQYSGFLLTAGRTWIIARTSVLCPGSRNNVGDQQQVPLHTNVFG